MDGIGIEIERYDQEEYEQVSFSASDGVLQGNIDINLTYKQLAKIAKSLIHFPKKIPDEYVFKIGKGGLQQSLKNDTPWRVVSTFFRLRAYTIDDRGHTSVEVTMSGMQQNPPYNEVDCCISITAEPNAIHRLGELIGKFSDEKYYFLKWSPNDDKDALEEWDNPLPPQPRQKWWGSFGGQNEYKVLGSDYKP